MMNKMITTIKYSVIVPIFNSQFTIEACMKSVLCSMRRDVELVLVDNASTDQTRDIIEKVLEEKEWESDICYYFEQKEGVSSARNTGIERARGEYILFLDSDDEIYPNYFDVLDSAGDSELVLYLMETKHFRRELQRSRIYIEEKNCDPGLSTLLRAGLLHSASNKRFRRNLINELKLRFDEKLSIGEDFLFSMKYCTHCVNVTLISKRIYKINTSNLNSLSRGYRPNLTEQLTLLFKLQEEVIHDCPLDDNTKSKLIIEMDFWHAKAVCSCIAETFKVNYGFYYSRRQVYQTIVRAFDKPLTSSCGYCNVIHRGLNWLLAHHLVYPIYVVTAVKKARSYKIYRDMNRKKL